MHSMLTTARLPIVSTLLLLLLTLTGCDKIGVEPSLLEEGFATTEAEIMSGGPAVTIDSVSFHDNYRSLVMQMHRHQNFDQHFIGDSTSVRVDVKEYIDALGLRLPSRRPATLAAMEVVGPKELEKLDVRLTCVIDLTLDYNLVERQRHALTDICGLFTPERMQVRFITDEGLSAPYSCTDYLIKSHIVPTGTGYKQLYRDILLSLTQQRGRCDGVIVMSDGRVYDDDVAMDDDHYALQERIYNLCTRGNSVSTLPPLYYYDLNPAPIGTTDEVTFVSQESESFIRLLTDYTGGYITHELNGYDLISDVLDRRGIDFSSIRLTLAQPEGKSFYGSMHEVDIEFRDAQTDSLITSVSHQMTLGYITSPIHTTPISLMQLLLQGILCMVLIGCLVVVAFQFVFPIVSFSIFKHRYMGRYYGKNTYIGGHIADGQCYYCKQNFVLGDEVVSACHHTMHRECWEEAEYRCPEHGHDPACKTSHHYYNSHNLLDPRNAHYSYCWFRWTTLAAFIAWVCNNLFPSVPVIVFAAFTLTAVFGALSMQRTHRYSLVVYVVARATVACLLVALAYRLIIGFYSWTDHPLVWLSLDTILCLTTAVIIAGCSKWHTLGGFHYKRFAIGLVALAGIKALVCLASLFSEEQVNLFLLFDVVLECFTLCAILCFPRNASLHYFLHLEGCMKPTDVALYKWFNAHPSAIVNIGSSPDCELRLEWDIQGSVAPLQARITQRSGGHYLEAMEKGVFDDSGHSIPMGELIRLYHGYRFVIGNNLFTYVEKDR